MSDRGDGVEMVVDGPWTHEATRAVRSGAVDRVILNYALGFEGTSLDFLAGLPLRELIILSPHLTDLEPIYSLGPTLKSLRVTTGPDMALDLRQLPCLDELAAAWPQVSETIGFATSLRVAFLRGYQPADLTPLVNLTGMLELVMKDRPRVSSLAGLAMFPSLRVLGVYGAKKLTDIRELADRTGVEDLSLEGCDKIERIDVLSGCIGLRRLNLSECAALASLSAIRGLASLEQISMFGSTRILDDDLSPIAGLPRLTRLRMRSRTSYTPSVEDIQARLQAPDSRVDP